MQLVESFFPLFFTKRSCSAPFNFSNQFRIHVAIKSRLDLEGGKLVRWSVLVSFKVKMLRCIRVFKRRSYLQSTVRNNCKFTLSLHDFFNDGESQLIIIEGLL